MALYTNTLTENKSLWLRTNITSHDELKNYMNASKEGVNVTLNIYHEEEKTFVSLASSEKPTPINALLKQHQSIKETRQAIIDHIQQLLD